MTPPVTPPTRLVYVIGEPGAGKTTLLNQALAGLQRTPQRLPVPHELLSRPVGCSSGRVVGAHLGRSRELFGGTDALSMSIQPAAQAWIAGHPYRLVVAEGDRLANARFFDICCSVGIDLQVVLLATPPAVAAQRRAARTPWRAQNERWIRGRITKTAHLADAYQALRLGGPGAAEDLRALCWPGGLTP